MTVSELIKALQACDPIAEVSVSVAAWNEYPFRRAFGEGALMDIAPAKINGKRALTLCFDGYENADMETEEQS